MGRIVTYFSTFWGGFNRWLGNERPIEVPIEQLNISNYLSEDGLSEIVEIGLLAYLERGRNSTSEAELTGERIRNSTIEELGDAMPRLIDHADIANMGGGGFGDEAGIPPHMYWDCLKHEIHNVLCTRSNKYAKLREQLAVSGGKTQSTVISLIAAGVASHLGIAAGALVPFCALVLLGVIRVGINAFCATQKLETTIGHSRYHNKEC